MFQALDGDALAVFGQLQAGYDSIHNRAVIDTLTPEPGLAHIAYEHLWGFPQNRLSAAAAQGFLERFGLEGEVLVNPFDGGAGEMLVRWHV